MRLTLLVLAALLATAAPAAAHPNPNGLPLRFGGTGEKVDGERRAGGAARAGAAAGLRARARGPETDIQGRVPAGNPEGFTCNTSLVGHHGDSGGYKALRFIDKAGPRVRVLRHDAAVPDQRADAVRAARPASPCST